MSQSVSEVSYGTGSLICKQLEIYRHILVESFHLVFRTVQSLSLKMLVHLDVTEVTESLAINDS